MKQRFYIYRRGETYYLQDSRTVKPADNSCRSNSFRQPIEIRVG